MPSIEPTLSQTWGWCLFISSHLIFISALPSLWYYSRLRQKNVSLSVELSLTEKEFLPEGLQLTRGTWDLLPQSPGSFLRRKETLTPPPLPTASVCSQSSETPGTLIRQLVAGLFSLATIRRNRSQYNNRISYSQSGCLAFHIGITTTELHVCLVCGFLCCRGACSSMCVCVHAPGGIARFHGA